MSPRQSKARKTATKPAPPPRLPKWWLQCMAAPLTGRVWNDKDCMSVVRLLSQCDLHSAQLGGGDSFTAANMEFDESGHFDYVCSEDQAPCMFAAAMPESSTPFLLLASAAASAELLRSNRAASGTKRRSILAFKPRLKSSLLFQSEIRCSGLYQSEEVTGSRSTSASMLRKSHTGPLFEPALRKSVTPPVQEQRPPSPGLSK